jgi:hypothetical protein
MYYYLDNEEWIENFKKELTKILSKRRQYNHQRFVPVFTFDLRDKKLVDYVLSSKGAYCCPFKVFTLDVSLKENDLLLLKLIGESDNSDVPWAKNILKELMNLVKSSCPYLNIDGIQFSYREGGFTLKIKEQD